jgi:hypothetical protein
MVSMIETILVCVTFIACVALILRSAERVHRRHGSLVRMRLRMEHGFLKPRARRPELDDIEKLEAGVRAFWRSRNRPFSQADLDEAAWAYRRLDGIDPEQGSIEVAHAALERMELPLTPPSHAT